MVVVDTTAYVVLMPVPWHQRKFLAANQAVELSIPEAAAIVGVITKLDRGVHTLNGRQFLMATAIVPEPNQELVPGLMLDCSISCDSVYPFEFLVRFLKSFLS